LAPTVTCSETSLVKVQVLEAESHVPIDAQSPPVASSVIVISAKAFGTKRIPSRKIPKIAGKIIFLVIFYLIGIPISLIKAWEADVPDISSSS